MDNEQEELQFLKNLLHGCIQANALAAEFRDDPEGSEEQICFLNEAAGLVTATLTIFLRDKIQYLEQQQKMSTFN